MFLNKKCCQSCGMPLAKDPMGGGTEASGKKNKLYCSYCYQRGSFAFPFLSAEQMVARVRGRLKEAGVSRFFSWLMTRHIPHLQRWRKK